jgi:hypothetical protein
MPEPERVKSHEERQNPAYLDEGLDCGGLGDLVLVVLRDVQQLIQNTA